MWVEKHRDVWRIRELVAGVKVTLKSGYGTKTAAKDAMATLRAEALRGDALVPRGGERTMAQFCADWWADVGPTFTRVRTSESMFGVMDRYISRLLGDVKLRELEETPAIVQRWVNDLSAGRTKPSIRQPHKLAPKTVRNAHGLLYQLMDYAITHRLIRANPCANTRLPDEVFSEHFYMTPAEADRLIAATPEHWRPIVLFLLATGCRWSEALGVRAKSLSVLDRKVTFTKKWIEDRSGHFREEDVKSRRGRRTVSFTDRVAQALIPLTMQGEDRERHVFLTRSGKDAIRHKEFYQVWHAARDEAGLPGLRVHDLRHTHVAWLIAGDVQIPAISRRLGHKSYTVTDGIYGHLTEEVNDRLVVALEDAMSIIDLGGIWGESGADQPRRGPVNAGEVPAQPQSAFTRQG